MTEKRYEWCADGIDIWDNQKQERIDYDFPVLLNEQHEQIERLKRNFKALDEVKCEIAEENEQLKQQIKIFEKFLEANDLDIDWVEFCGVDECAFENPDFSCQECIHLKGDVE